MKFRSLGAWAVAGVALWVSMGVLDVTAGPAGPVRVAMLPGVAELGAAIVLAVLAGLVTERRLSEARRRDVFLPLYSLAVLALPYLPWLPDALPFLRVFAGPGRYMVWLIVGTQVVWAAVGTGRGPRLLARVRSSPGMRSVPLVWIVSVLVFGSAALAMVPTVLYPGGDEPHYLILAQSIWLDGDLAIENNHARRDFEDYFGPGPLEPHALARGLNGKAYSVHPIGLPMLVAPVMGHFGYTGVVVLLVFIAASASTIAWHWVRRFTGSVSAATFGWAATALSLPFVCGSPLVYPEIPAALLVLIALHVGLRERPSQDGAQNEEPAPPWRLVVLGLVSGGLPWMGSKYALLSAALVAVGCWRAMIAWPSWQRRVTAWAWTAVPYGISIAAWFGFFYTIWGSPWPSAAYGGAEHTQMALANVARGVPGILFDQEYGLLLYAPALAIGAAGFLAMWRDGGRHRQRAVELAVIVGALLVTVTGHAMWWGGSSLPGRFMLAGLLVLAIPVAREYQRAAGRPDLRAVYRLLLLIGFAATAVALFAADGALLANQRDGISRLLGWLSPDWHLWAFAPDFIAQPTRWGLVQVAVAAAAVTLVWVGWRAVVGQPRGVALSRVGRGAAFLRANVSAAAAVLLVTLLTPFALRPGLKDDVDPEGRHRIPMLDSFDPQARPLAVRYGPFGRIAAETVPAEFELSATPGSRRASQPARVLLNARFSLPSGRYDVVLRPLPDRSLAGPLELQGGLQRGPALDAWAVESTPGAPWRGSFNLPVDLSFVGFRADAGMADAVGELRIRPERVVPTLNRTPAYDVVASAGLVDGIVFLFHDGGSYPEETGFWVRGRSETHVSVVARTGPLTEPVKLRIRNGPVPNTIRILTPESRQQITFESSEIKEVTLTPTPLDGTLRIVIAAEHGFVPADKDPGSADRRLLGVWVEVVG